MISNPSKFHTILFSKDTADTAGIPIKAMLGTLGGEKYTVFSWEKKAGQQELSTENVSDWYLGELADSWINQYQLDPRLVA